MKNRSITKAGLFQIATAVAVAASVTACATTQPQSAAATTEQANVAETEVEPVEDSQATTEPLSGLANPWTETDQEGVLEATGFEISAPEGASDVVYSYMEEIGMAQVRYVLDGHDWTYRIESVAEPTDISGMYYEWTSIETTTVQNRPAEHLIYVEPSANTEYIDNIYGVQVVNWYDAVPGVEYSLSVAGIDLNGMDLPVIAEELFHPTQGEAETDDPEGYRAAELSDYFLGTHERTDDGSTLTITEKEDGTFGVDLSIVRLTSMEGGVGTFDEHKITFTITDPAEKEMKGVIYRDSDNSLTVQITDSTWEYLPNGEVITGFGR